VLRVDGRVEVGRKKTWSIQRESDLHRAPSERVREREMENERARKRERERERETSEKERERERDLHRARQRLNDIFRKLFQPHQPQRPKTQHELGQDPGSHNPPLV